MNIFGVVSVSVCVRVLASKRQIAVYWLRQEKNCTLTHTYEATAGEGELSYTATATVNPSSLQLSPPRCYLRSSTINQV